MENRNKTLLEIFLTFLRIGAFTFGGGYAMIPLIQKETVEKHGWISDKDILEIVAIAESTPGPIAVNSATFLGLRLHRSPLRHPGRRPPVLPGHHSHRLCAPGIPVHEGGPVRLLRDPRRSPGPDPEGPVVHVPPVSEESGFLCHCGRFLHPGGHPERQRASGTDPLCRRRLSCIHHFLKEG